MSGDNLRSRNVSFPFSGHGPRNERRIGAGAMGLTLIEMMFSIFRGHIPDHVVRTTTAIAVPPAAVLGVFAAAAAAIGIIAAALWATVWLALWLI
jgi:hypothetical protein